MITNFFDFLSEIGIQFCIQNGYEDLSASDAQDSDVDLLLKGNDFLNVEYIVKSFCEKYDYKLVQIYNQDFRAKNIFIFDPLNNQLLNLDVYGELSRRGVVIFSETSVFDSLGEYQGVPIMSPAIEFVYYLVKKLDKNQLGQDAFEHLRQLFLASEVESRSKLKSIFQSTCNTIFDAFTFNEKDKVDSERNSILVDFDLNKLVSLDRSIHMIKRYFVRVVRPTGIVISFLGPDGVGKSMVIDALLAEMLPFRKSKYFHLKPFDARKDVGSIKEPHGSRCYGFIISYIKLIYFVIQYNFGWAVNVLGLRVRSTLIVFDRYYDDLLVDPKRYRFGGSLCIARLFKLLIPSPDLYFVLTADPKIIFSRKEEVFFSELERQVLEYKSLSDGVRYLNVDTNRKPKEIVRSVVQDLMSKMNERY